MVNLEIWKSAFQGGFHYELRGEVDLSTVDRLREALNCAVRDQVDVRVDMRYVDFIGSSGVGVLLGVLETLRAWGRTLVIMAASPSAARVFELLRVGYLLDMGLAQAV